MEEPETKAVADEPRKKRGRTRKAAAGRASIIPDGRVEKFPKERFLKFVGALSIQSKDAGLVPLRLLGSQRYLMDELIEGLERGITTFVILKYRQGGISTFFLALDMFWAMEHNGLLGIFATHEEGSREQFRNQIEVFFNNLPSEFKLSIKTNNKNMLVFDPPCSSVFQYLVAGTRGSTNKMGRSGGGNYLHATECAFWGSEDDVKALNQTLSEKYPFRFYAYESTANGFNHYERMWQTALESPAQKAIFIGWWRDERYEFSANHPLYNAYMPQGVKTTLTAHEKAMVKKVREYFGYQITAGQIAWYRYHLETKCDGDLETMMQEMPAHPEEAFRATGSQFFSNEAITRMAREARKFSCMPFIFTVTDNPLETALKNARINQATFKIWEKPVPTGKYILSCDPAFGSDANSDNSTICVGRAFADCIVQVAEFAAPGIKPFQLAWILAYISGVYGDVFLILEMQGGGYEVNSELKKIRSGLHGIAAADGVDLTNCLKYMKNYLYRRDDILTGNCLYQWVMNGTNKPHLFERYKTGFETGRVRVRSLGSLEEHRKFVREESGYIGGDGRAKDDRVIAPALMYFAWDQWIRDKMARQGHTMDVMLKQEAAGGPDPVATMMRKFLTMRNIVVKDVENA